MEQSRSSWNVEQGRESAVECGHLGGSFLVHAQWAVSGRSGGNLLGQSRSLGQGGSRAELSALGSRDLLPQNKLSSFWDPYWGRDGETAQRRAAPQPLCPLSGRATRL